MKRVKSFFISLGSFAIASLSTLVFTPQFADFINWAGSTANAKLLGWGFPAVVVIVLGKFIDEIWRQILNKYIARKQFGEYGSIRKAGISADFY